MEIKKTDLFYNISEQQQAERCTVLKRIPELINPEKLSASMTTTI